MVDQLAVPSATKRWPQGLAGLARAAGLTRFSGLYALAIVILVFWRVLGPAVWLSRQNVAVVLSEASIVGLLAIAAVIPMSAALLDISFAHVAGFGMGLLAWLALHTTVNVWLLAGLVVLSSSAFGLMSGVIVAALRLPSLIVTLGMSSIALAITQFLLGGQTLYPRSRLARSFLSFGTGEWGPIPISAVLLILITVAAWAWIEHTPSGRRLLAVGGNPAAAHLAGVCGARYQIAGLVLSSTISGLAGVVLLATIGTADDVSGSAYLLPVIAAVFLGSTQVKSRFNVAGTFVAVILIQTGIHGIELAGLNQWVDYVFDGAVLLLAVIVSRGSRRYAF